MSAATATTAETEHQARSNSPRDVLCEHLLAVETARIAMDDAEQRARRVREPIRLANEHRTKVGLIRMRLADEAKRAVLDDRPLPDTNDDDLNGALFELRARERDAEIAGAAAPEVDAALAAAHARYNELRGKTPALAAQVCGEEFDLLMDEIDRLGRRLQDRLHSAWAARMGSIQSPPGTVLRDHQRLFREPARVSQFEPHNFGAQQRISAWQVLATALQSDASADLPAEVRATDK
jgi:hypothetical protein